MKKLAAVLIFTLALGVVVSAHGNLLHILGTVVEIGDHSVSVKTTDGTIKVVAFDGETRFVKGDSPASAKDLAVGVRVAIHAHANGDKMHAAEIKIANAAASGSHH